MLIICVSEAFAVFWLIWFVLAIQSNSRTLTDVNLVAGAERLEQGLLMNLKVESGHYGQEHLSKRKITQLTLMIWSCTWLSRSLTQSQIDSTIASISFRGSRPFMFEAGRDSSE